MYQQQQLQPAEAAEATSSTISPAISTNPAVTPISIAPYSHYTTQYPAATSAGTYTASALSYLPPYPHIQQTKAPTPPPERPPSPPDLVNSITPEIASKTMTRLIINEIKDAGFDSAQTTAIQRIELELLAFIQELFRRAHEYANLSNRAGTIATDLVMSCKDFGMTPKDIYSVRRRKNKKSGPTDQIHNIVPFELLPAPSRSPSPDLLPSDDETGPTIMPSTLRGFPNLQEHLPALPPKHTYLRTPASPPKKAALPSLEKKLKNAALVQKSLGNLLSSTEDSTNHEDDKLLGHIVNWEMGVHPRKRWRVG
ncbi:hypothetical protein AX16_000191 [Volvariella volvacea WC 439]|nr:hypothetical protein AX16_000191 [Volvariella volvacea WC 439]